MDEISEADRRKNKRLNLKGKEDRISALPDSLLHHILSFLPLAEEVIRTGVVSKRWLNQWTRVPVLIFKTFELFDSHDEYFARFIDNTLIQYDCSKIKKLHFAYDFAVDINFCSKIRFGARKHVEELILDCSGDAYLLPKLLFDTVSLVKLEMINCYFIDDWTPNWGSLKALTITGYECGKLVRNVLPGCPSLESLELNPYGSYGNVFAFKSLKTLILVDIVITKVSGIEISCPNLEELSVKSSTDYYARLPDKVIENVVSDSPLLRSLELKNCYFEKLVIASESLEKLILRNPIESCAIVISCPNLEEVNFCGYCNGTLEFMDSPSLICATLDFEMSEITGASEDTAMNIFSNLQNVKELTIGNWFIKILSDVEMRDLSYQWLNNKILTLSRPNFEHLPGIVCALRSSPALERLVIKLDVHKGGSTSNASGENCCNSSGIVSSCLVSHLKTVEIIGLSKRDAQHELVLNLIKFLLKNARVLEKLVLVISEYGGTSFAFKISQKVSSFPRYSRHAIVELLNNEVVAS